MYYNDISKSTSDFMFEYTTSNFTVNNNSYGEAIINISEREGYTPILATYAVPGGSGGTWWVCVSPVVVILNDNRRIIAMMRRVDNAKSTGTYSASFIIVYKKYI